MRSDAVSVFSFLFVCLIVAVTAYSGEDAQNLARLGGKMSAADKESLEEQVAKSPNDVDSRTKLLGYYFIKGRQDADAKSNRQRHVVWLIENAPESDVLGLPYSGLNKVLETEGYDRAKQAWLKIIEKSPEKLSILKNASTFFLLHDRKISEELLLKGQTLAAKDPEWPASLGQLYSLELMSLSGEKRCQEPILLVPDTFSASPEHLIRRREGYSPGSALAVSRLRHGLAFELIDVGQHFGHGGVHLVGNRMIHVDVFVKGLRERLLLDDRNAVLEGQAADALR